MQKMLTSLGLLLGTFAPAAMATCPHLPQGTDVQWEESSGQSHRVCRAIDADGNQLLGVMFTEGKPLKLSRRNRVEEGTIGGREVHWYRPEIAQADAAEKRVTVLELSDDRYAQVWIDANDPEQLRRALNLAARLALY